MYSHLKDKIIDNSIDEFKEFPDFLNGYIYISGNDKEGWHTRENLTSEESQARIQESINRKAKAYLLSTDWYIIRSQETGQSIPDEVIKLRQEARERIR